MELDNRTERFRNLPPAKRELLLRLLQEKAAQTRDDRAIPRAGLTGPFPLSFAQRRLWFLDRLTPGSPAYNIATAVGLEGELDIAALATGLREIARRHEVLRASFPTQKRQPVQTIAAGSRVPLPLIDLGALPAPAADREIRELVREEARRPFDLSAGPVLRTCLIRRGMQDHLLLFTLHHIVSDGWSAANFTRELGLFYAALRSRRPAELPELPIQYTDFAVWQRGRLQSAALAAQIAYWQRQLAGSPPLLELPADRPRPAVPSFRGAFRELVLDTGLTQALRGLARSSDATLFMVLLASFQLLLARLSGQSDVLIGVPVANRTRPELEPLIGLFVNTLVLRADLSGRPSFRAFLTRVAEATLGAYDHQDVPFERLVDEMGLERNLSHTPLFQVTFALQNAPGQPVELPGGGLVLRPLEGDNGTAKFDLSVSFTEVAGHLAGGLQHSTDLFDGTTVGRWLGHLRRLLTAVVADPEGEVWMVPLLSPAERHQVLREWRGATEEHAASGTLQQGFAAWMKKTPEAPAAVCGDEVLTYAGLATRAAGLSRELRARGARPGEPVGLYFERGLDLVVGILGILTAGCAYVPLDPSHPRERLALLLEDTGARLVVTGAAAQAALPVPTVTLGEEPPGGALPPEPLPPLGAGWPAYIIHTSGSTGRPKGVVVTHGNVLRLFAATRRWFDFGPGDTWTLFHSFAFDFSVWELWGALLHGGRLVVVPQEVSRSARAFHELLARERVTVLNQTPSAFRQLIQVDAAAPAESLSALRWVIFGGEALEPRSLAPWIARHGEDRPVLVNMYGITETTVHVTWRRIGRAEAEKGAGSLIGVPIPDLSLLVLDRAGQPVPAGVAGELHVGGAGVAMGYLGQPALCAERFVPDPFGTAPGARLYRSGDLARWRADGDVEYLGRIDLQVKIRGFRIELGEIEAALTQHPRVGEVVVLAREDTPGDRRLVAYLAGTHGAAAPRVEELRAFLGDRLPEHMIPAFFIEIPALPLTRNGKIDRHALPAPGGERPDLEQSYVPPRTALEEALCAVWSEALGVDRVGIGDNFFALGGDSILSLRVAALAGERGIEISLPDLFRHQTVAGLAAWIVRSTAEPEPGTPAEAPLTAPFSLVSAADREHLPEEVEDAYPLTQLQAGMLYHMELTRDEPLYHNVDSWHIRAPFAEAPLRAAVARVVARHAVLRTGFDLTGAGEPLQLVYREAVLPITVADLRGLPPASQEEVIDALVAGEKRRLFDFARPVQLRLHIHLRSAETFQLTLTENHAILDGWSLHTVLSEIFTLYFALLDGEEPALPPPAATYRDYVFLERQALDSAEAAAYWRKALDGCEPVGLPAWPGWTVNRQPPRTRDTAVPLSDGDAAGLGALARRASVPLKSVLLAAHLKALAVLGGGPEILTGIATNGRLEVPGGDEVCGLFLNSLPLRFRLPAGSWLDLAVAALRAEEDMLPYRRYPLAALQRQWGDRPLVEINFNYTHFHVAQDLQSSGRLDLLGFKKDEGANFKVTVNFSQNVEGSRLRLDLEHDSYVLPAAQVEAMADIYARVLAAMAAHPAAPHDADPLLPPAARHQVLVEWSGGGGAWPEPHLLHELFAGQARRSPGASAVVCGEEELSYGELDGRSDRLAHALRRQGVGPEVLVGVCLERSPELVVALLGVLKAGGAYLPLDPAYPQDRLSYLLSDSGAAVLVTRSELLERLPASGAATLLLDRLPLEGGAPGAPATTVVPDNAAYVIYTSGSTGRPKGVVVAHAQVARLFSATEPWFGFGEKDVWTLFHSYAFDFSVWELWGALLYGGSLVVVPYLTSRSPEAFLDLLRWEGVTVLNQTPSAFRPLIQAEEAQPGGLSLRWVIFGGEVLELQSLRPWFDRHGDRVPQLVNMYGITETTVHVTYRRLRSSEGPLGSLIGVPIPDLRVYLLEGRGQPVPIGVAGEIHVAGAGLARGYLSRPELTAERFVPDPFGEPGGRLYRSGDLARYTASGELEYLGRIDHQVKVRGFRIEPGEIEAALVSHPRVREAVVLVRDKGQEDQRLVAWVVADEEGVPTTELREHLRQCLPDYMVPAAFVLLQALPLTPNGKIDRRALPEPEVAGEAVSSFVAARTPPEEILAGIWADVLGVGRVGVLDDFFALGGHSLLATRVIARIRRIFGVELALAEFFEEPTIAGLALRIEQARDGGRWGRAVPPPLVRVLRSGPLPLSLSQQRLWLVDQIEPGSSLYNMPLALRLSGPLHAAALAAALGEVVRRHEALRTVFATDSREPVQVILPPSAPAFPQVDLAGLAAARRDREMERLAAEEAVRSFDLARGPLLRALLLRLSEGEHAALLTLHHIVSDGWSMGLLVREMADLYATFAAGRPSHFPELPLQYADFAVWQRSWLQGQVLEEEIAYWREQLAGLPPILELPADRPRPAVRSARGASRPGEVAADLARELRSFGRLEGATPFMVLLAAFQAWLARATGQADLAVGSPVAGRDSAEVEGLIGFFVNMLVLRGDLRGNPSFQELVGRVREVCLAAQAHDGLPFDRLLEELRPDRSLSHTPLFQVAFALENTPRDAVENLELRVEPLDLPSRTAKFDLLLGLADEGGPLRGAWEYSTDLFDATTIARFASNFEVLLKNAVRTPDLRLFDLPLLTAPEQAQILVEWNQTGADVPRNLCLHELFAAQVERTPYAVAVVSGEERLSYRDLEKRANRLARHLCRLSVAPGSLVGLCVERSVEMVVALLGILKAGCAYVPFDPSSPCERLAWMMADTHVGVLVTQEPLLDRLPQSTARVLCLDRDAAAVARECADRLAIPSWPDSLAYVMFTSGSTGRPKGVAVPHRAVVRLVRDTDFMQLGPEQVFLQLAPISFDASTLEIWGPLLNGGRLVVMPPEIPSLYQLGEALQRHEVTALWLTAGLFHQMVDERLESLVHVGQLLAGGDVLSPVHVRRVLKSLPGTRLINGYGPTENTTFTCCGTMEEPSAVGASVPIGRPISGTRVYLLDQSGRPVPIGVAGELYAGGEGLAQGYFEAPELTAEQFVPDPFGPAGSRLYRTGDFARWRPTGDIEFLGRRDQQVKVRGFRIELGEVETALAGCVAVGRAVVTVREDLPGGRGLAAYIVPAAGESPSAGDLREHLRHSLPDYMVPSAFVLLEALPLMPNGKVDRRGLPEPETAVETGPSFAPAHTPTEEILAGIWADVLGLGRVGMLDDFFALGGHSLLATQVISRVRSAFGVELPLRDLFEASTVAGLATRLEAALRAGWASQAPLLVPVPRQGALPLSFAQQRLWLVDQIEPDSPAYNMPMALRLIGEIEPRLLERIFSEIVRRHEALRTTFSSRDNSPVQVIAPPEPVAMRVLDLSSLPESERETQARDLAFSEAQRPFDLLRGPLLRLLLVCLAETDHLLLLTLHHIVSDGWSMGVLLREITALHEAFSQDRPSPLPELPVQYADFAVWQRSWLQGEVLDAQFDYWKRQLDGAPAVLELPLDRPRPAVQSYRGARCPVVLSSRLSEAIGRLCRQQVLTPFMALLASWAVLLGRHTGQDDVLVGAPIAGRNRREIESLIGFFVNTLVLRSDLSGNPSLAELLGQVRRTALDAFSNQDLPFERLVEDLAPERSLAHAPLFQVMFVLQNVPAGNLTIPGLTLSPVDVDAGQAKFDLSLSLFESPEGFAGALTYATDLFDPSTAERLIAGFQTVLAAMVEADPAAPLHGLEVLPEAERRQLLVEWSAEETWISALSLYELFERQAEQTPDAVAVIYEEERWTYRDLLRRSREIAGFLREQGVGPEDRVAILDRRSAERVARVLGVLASGSAFVAVDREQPSARRAEILADVAPVWVFPPRPPLPEEREAEMGVGVAFLEGGTPASPGSCSWGLESCPGPAYVVYTSGSTGCPKGILAHHRGAATYLEWVVRNYGLSESDVALQLAPLTFDASLRDTLAPLVAGGRIVIVPEDVARDPAALLERIEAHGVTCLPSIVPSLLRLLAEEALTSGRKVPSLRLILASGEKLHGADATAVRRAFGERVSLVNQYGASEATMSSTWYAVTADDEARPALPVGRPAASARVFLLDRSLRPVPLGAVGEICFGGPGLTFGYLGQPDRTAEAFVPDPFGPPGERLYRTGDRGRYHPDGVLALLGRIDFQAKIRGHRVEPGEVEAVLSSHPGVRQAVVTVRGEDESRLAAWLVADGVGADDLRAFLAERLPAPMIPADWAFLDALPLTPHGKVDRSRLPEPSRERTAVQEPRDRTELRLVHLWEEVLGIQPVGISDNFFTLGGHSLSAVRLMAGIRRLFGRDLPLSELFRRPTIEMLADILRRNEGERPWSPLVALTAGRAGEVPLFCIHGGDGHALTFADFARTLSLAGEDRPVFALEARGLADGQKPLERIEELADLYLTTIREAWPRRPYRLLGYSMGSKVAFEMARRLEQEGETVERLIFLDISALPRLEAIPNLEVPAEIRALPGFDPELADRYLAVWRANLKASHSWTPVPFGGKVLLFVAEEGTYAGALDSTLGWGAVAEGGVEVASTPGDHFSLLRPPHVQALVARIRELSWGGTSGDPV